MPYLNKTKKNQKKQPAEGEKKRHHLFTGALFQGHPVGDSIPAGQETFIRKLGLGDNVELF